MQNWKTAIGRHLVLGQVNLCLWQNAEFENLGGKMTHVFKCKGGVLEGEKVCLTTGFHKLLNLI